MGRGIDKVHFPGRFLALGWGRLASIGCGWVELSRSGSWHGHGGRPACLCQMVDDTLLLAAVFCELHLG